MKKLIYIANIRIPTEKAHGIQIMEMCASFADSEMEVKLIVPRRINAIKEDPFVYHDMRRNFSIKKLPTIDLVRFGRVGFLVQSFSFAISVFFFSVVKKGYIFYTRDELLALMLKILGKNVIWEAHMGHTNFVVKLVIKLGVKIVVISNGLKKLYLSYGVLENNLHVAPDGVDLERFDIDVSKTEARKKLGLPLDKKIALYKGHLYEWKGVDVFAKAAMLLKGEDIMCIFIGGTEVDIESFRKKYGQYKNIFILGNKPRKETPFYQKASDIVIIPNSGEKDISKLYTSPMKLFGYMASGVPIISADLPSLREVLNEKNTKFFEADNPESLKEAILDVVKNEESSQELAKQALRDVGDYTWEKRSNKIINFIENI